MHDLDNTIYFAPILPWHTNQWQQLTARYERLPHGLLFSGMTGIGKRAFVWRYVAWLLCDNRIDGEGRVINTACGHCQSCQWLLAGTHPDLKVLPKLSQPVAIDVDIDSSTNKNKADSHKNKKTSKATKNTPTKQNKVDDKKVAIKVDDIRELQPFISQGSTGRRICVIDNADMMTVAAANALLKTLEEPRQGIHLFLISDVPTKLLPTIRSRVQKVPIDQLSSDGIHNFLERAIVNRSNNAQSNIAQSNNASSTQDNFFIDLTNNSDMLVLHINQTLKLANGAPLAAFEILNSIWYQQRQTWLKTWLALRANKRSSVAASDYWQTLLPLSDFILLCETMLLDMSRYTLGLLPLQTDVRLQDYDTIKHLKLNDIQHVLSLIDDIKLSMQQNVQDKLGYDRLMASLQNL